MANSITIKNLPKDTFVPELCDLFQTFGNIVSATIQYDDATESYIEEAYIEFEDEYAALRAVRSRDGFRLKNKTLRVSLSIEKSYFKKVFVKNFNPAWDECDLLKAFEGIGDAEKVIISEGNGYGFLVFGNHITAKRAVATMNGKIIDGQKLIVERFKSKTERESLMQNSLEHVEKQLQQSVQRNNLYIKNLLEDMTEEKLRKLFERYGEITSVKIAVDDKGVSRQFGFVSFKNVEDADRALNRMNGYSLKGKKLQISFKEDGQLRKLYNSLKNKEKNIKIKQYKQRAKSVPKFLPMSLTYKGPRGYF